VAAPACRPPPHRAPSCHPPWGRVCPGTRPAARTCPSCELLMRSWPWTAPLLCCQPAHSACWCATGRAFPRGVGGCAGYRGIFAHRLSANVHRSRHRRRDDDRRRPLPLNRVGLSSILPVRPTATRPGLVDPACIPGAPPPVPRSDAVRVTPSLRGRLLLGGRVFRASRAGRPEAVVRQAPVRNGAEDVFRGRSCLKIAWSNDPVVLGPSGPGFVDVGRRFRATGRTTDDRWTRVRAAGGALAKEGGE
jgi:hypothetical protein